MSTTTFRQQTPDGVFEVGTAGHADRGEGERRKQAALSNLEQRRARCILRAQRALLERLLAVGRATADDVRAAVELPVDIDPKMFGAIPRGLVKSGIIEAVGYTKTTRPEAHARPVTVWGLTDRDKAEQWLRDHPVPAIERPVQRELFEEGGAP